MGRNLRTNLDLVKPDIRLKVQNNQLNQARSKGKTYTRKLTVGQTVSARSYRKGEKWAEGVIQEQIGPLLYKVEINPDTVWKRHIDQLKERETNQNDDTKNTNPNEWDGAPKPHENPATIHEQIEETSPTKEIQHQM